MESKKQLWVCSYKLLQTQPSCTSMGQAWLMTHTQLSLVTLPSRRCSKDVWAATTSWTGKCLSLHLLTTCYHKKISLPDQCLLLHAPHTQLFWGPRDVVIPAAATSTPGTLSWPPLCQQKWPSLANALQGAAGIWGGFLLLLGKAGACESSSRADMQLLKLSQPALPCDGRHKGLQI